MKKILTYIGYSLYYTAIAVFVFSMGYFGSMTINDYINVKKDLKDVIVEVDKTKSVLLEGIDVTRVKIKELEDADKENFLRTQDFIVSFASDNKKRTDNISSAVGRVRVKLERQIKEVVKKPTYEQLKSHTVYMVNKINAFQGSVGTGVVVKKTPFVTYVMTNKHVCNVADQDKCFVEIFKYGTFIRIPLDFVKQDKEYDVALWRTKQKLPGKKAIKGLEQAFPQDRVFSVGNYLGLKYVYTEGTFAGYEEDLELVNMPCVYGCSGSAIFNKDSNLVGLVFAVNVINPYTGAVDTTKAITVPYEILKIFLRGVI